MLNSHRVVALVPARAGSKRLKNKNLLPLAGRPLVGWTIQAALDSRAIDDVVVSTDSLAIKDVAIELGAKVPFIRPSGLAGDLASTDDVLMHAIDELQLNGDDILILLQPTSPLRDTNDIKTALRLFDDRSIRGVVSVCECEHSPMWSNTLPKNMLMSEFIRPEIASKRSQDLPPYYRLNGAIYAYRVSYLKQHNSRFYSNEIKATIMPASKSIDIDNEIDFQFASFMMAQATKKNDV